MLVNIPQVRYLKDVEIELYQKLHQQFLSEWEKCPCLRLFETTTYLNSRKGLTIHFQYSQSSISNPGSEDRSIIIKMTESGGGYLYWLAKPLKQRSSFISLDLCIRAFHVQFANQMSTKFVITNMTDVFIMSWIVAQGHRASSEEEERLWIELETIPFEWNQIARNLSSLLNRKNDDIGKHRLYYILCSIVHLQKVAARQLCNLESEITSRSVNSDFMQKLSEIGSQRKIYLTSQ